MLLSEMLFEGVIVDVVLLLCSLTFSIADMTSFMFVPAMCVQLIISIESLLAEPTLGMSSESALVYRTRMIITKFFMFS